VINGSGSAQARQPVLITGGAGFIGVNLAERLLSEGTPVRVLDNLSRSGVRENLDWLRSRHAEQLQAIEGDIRDAELVRSAVDGCSFVYHLAAQVAVTTSLRQPAEDHAVNTIGTLNVLEALRAQADAPPMMFASTNKVYGDLSAIAMERRAQRSEPADPELRRHGIAEDQPLDFLSPYGCSKGAADQYVLDYARSFGLPTVVLRMSCIYGLHQRATIDQGWVAHFLQTALRGHPLTIFGSGRQVRDVLFVDDFVDALCLVRQHATALCGNAFNIGGGAENTLSLLEMIGIAEELNRQPLEVRFHDARPGDQDYFAADYRRFASVTGWRPRTAPRTGIERLWSWLESSMPAVQPEFARPRQSVS
jgi:CDP-paratose 2-epimerase